MDASETIKRGYRKAAQRAVGLTEDWQEAEDLANRLVSAVLDGSVVRGRWDPAERTWVALD